MGKLLITEAIILAGGQGTRLREIVKDVPKPMALINGKPFIEYLIKLLVASGIFDIIISTGYKSKIIEDYFGDGSDFNCRIKYSIENEPLGTGGALKLALENNITNENFILLNGDSIVNIDFNKLLEFHTIKKSLITMSVIKIQDAERYGKVVINESLEVVDFIEKGNQSDGFINCGIYVINKKILNHIPKNKNSLENDVLPFLTGKGFYAYKTTGFFIDIGIPKDYIFLNENIKLIEEILAR